MHVVSPLYLWLHSHMQKYCFAFSVGLIQSLVGSEDAKHLGLQQANSIFIEKYLCISGPVLFKLVFFKGQLSPTTQN